MAPLPLDLEYAERLRSQADALERRGLALVSEGQELKREALEMRIEADQLAVVRVAVKRPASVPVAPAGASSVRVAATPDRAFMDRVVAMLANGGMTVGQLADHLGTSKLRVRGALQRLEDEGAVYRTGATKGTRYHVPEPDPVRTGTATLHVFTKTTSARELEDRRVAFTTEAPVPAGALPERDAD